MASQGDWIQCFVNFKNEQVIDGKKKVPVYFFLNEIKMITKEGEYCFFMDSDRPLYPYVAMTDGCSAQATVRVINGTFKRPNSFHEKRI